MDATTTDRMLDLARHIVNQKAGKFEPEKFEDQYEAALIELINSKRAGKPVAAKARPDSRVGCTSDNRGLSLGGGSRLHDPRP
jgi:DNA end-binding protein Ku